MATEDDLPDEPVTGDAGEAGRDDRRAKDLDAATLAELAAWFDLPSVQVVEERQALAAEESAESDEWRQAQERRAAATAAADPALIAYVSRHETMPPPFKTLPPVELKVDESIVLPLVREQLDRLDQGDLAVMDERPYGVPTDIADAVSRHNAPQAILRDLYRPVSDFSVRFESPFDVDDMPPVDPTAEVREALRVHLTVPWLEPAMNTLDETWRELDEILARPWDEMAAAAKAWREAALAEGS